MLQLGQNFQVAKGDGASPEVFTLIAGQTGLSRGNSTNLIEQSNKTSGQFGIQAPGRKTLSYQVTGIRDLPDANGLEAVYAQQNVYPQVPAIYQVQDVSQSPVDVVFACSMYVSNFAQDDPDQDNGSYSFTLTVAAAPTIDDLTP
jgi:hypothetical protein